MTTVLWLVSMVIGVGLWVLLIVKARGLVPFARANLRERQDRLAASLRSAEESKRRLAEVQAQIDHSLAQARGQGDEILQRARAEALAVADEIGRRGRADAQGMLERARTDIAVERDRAIQELRRQTAAMVVEAAGRVVARSIDGPAHQRLIEQSLRAVKPDADGRN